MGFSCALSPNWPRQAAPWQPTSSRLSLPASWLPGPPSLKFVGYFVFVTVIFLGLGTVVALFRFRRDGDKPKASYRAWGYPLAARPCSCSWWPSCWHLLFVADPWTLPGRVRRRADRLADLRYNQDETDTDAEVGPGQCTRQVPAMPERIRIFMTWIQTIPLSEADERLRAAIEEQRALYPVEYARRPPDADGDARDRRIAQPDSRRALPCLRDVRRADVARFAADAAAARDDRDRGFGHNRCHY